MKRLNPETGLPFKHGDKREDGYIFNTYSSGLNKKGYRYEHWLSPEAFKKAKQRSKGSFSKSFYEGKNFVDSYKKKKGCFCCGYNIHPSALDFDHINPEEKTMNVSQMLALNKDRLLAEVKKCQVLCANCHRIKTADPELFNKLNNVGRNK